MSLEDLQKISAKVSFSPVQAFLSGIFSLTEAQLVNIKKQTM